MKKKKMGPRIIFGAFLVIICFSWFFWIFGEKYFDTSNYENREKAPAPNLTIDNYYRFSRKYTKYFNDNIPFRNNLITVNSSIDYFIFKKSSSDYVIVGNDNWLFYNRIDDGDPISCYKGTNLLSESELQTIAQNCVNQRDFLSEQGIEFVIYIAPNKERIYSEKMPSQYGEPAKNYQALQIVNYLRKNTDLRVVYPYDELMKAKTKIPYNIWYKTDTHWNLLGGYVGASALLKELGIEMPAIDSDRIQIKTGDDFSGDLSAMLNLKSQLKFADKEYFITGYNTHGMKNIEWDFDNMISYSAINADPRTIYVERDSFSSNMSSYIGSQFNNTYLRHKRTYSYDDFDYCNPDIFVYETVERNICDLCNFSIQ